MFFNISFFHSNVFFFCNLHFYVPVDIPIFFFLVKSERVSILFIHHTFEWKYLSYLSRKMAIKVMIPLKHTSKLFFLGGGGARSTVVYAYLHRLILQSIMVIQSVHIIFKYILSNWLQNICWANYDRPTDTCKCRQNFNKITIAYFIIYYN